MLAMTPQASIRPCELPQGALLRKYLYAGAYTDCYVTDIPRRISQPEYVEAFYTTAVFKAERLLLKWLISRPSTDSEAKQLAAGALSSFAAWRVEGRAANQLLLSDITGRTKSWLMIAPLQTGSESDSTRLYFGSAVVPVISRKSRKRTLGFTFRSLLGFHKLYSRVLLFAARSRLTRAGASV
jgi:hypothetical protein